MSECPYKNFRSKVDEFIELLRKPTKHFGGLPPCPFVASEVEQDKLMIDLFDPSDSSIIDKVNELIESNYDSLLLVQVMDGSIDSEQSHLYELYINKILKNSKHSNYKCVCFNPQDKMFSGDLNIRKHSPYIMLNIAKKDILAKSHKKLSKTKYYDKMDENYLNYLGVKKEEK